MKTILAAAIVAVTAAGCATGPIETSERFDRDYTTGSNIPKRTRSGDEPGMTTLNRETLQRQLDTTSIPQPTPRPASLPGSP